MAPLIRFSEKSLHRPKHRVAAREGRFSDPYSTRGLNESVRELQLRDQGGCRGDGPDEVVLLQKPERAHRTSTPPMRN